AVAVHLGRGVAHDAGTSGIVHDWTGELAAVTGVVAERPRIHVIVGNVVAGDVVLRAEHRWRPTRWAIEDGYRRLSCRRLLQIVGLGSIPQAVEVVLLDVGQNQHEPACETVEPQTA